MRFYWKINKENLNEIIVFNSDKEFIWKAKIEKRFAYEFYINEYLKLNSIAINKDNVLEILEWRFTNDKNKIKRKNEIFDNYLKEFCKWRIYKNDFWDILFWYFQRNKYELSEIFEEILLGIKVKNPEQDINKQNSYNFLKEREENYNTFIEFFYYLLSLNESALDNFNEMIDIDLFNKYKYKVENIYNEKIEEKTTWEFIAYNVREEISIFEINKKSEIWKINECKFLETDKEWNKKYLIIYSLKAKFLFQILKCIKIFLNENIEEQIKKIIFWEMREKIDKETIDFFSTIEKYDKYYNKTEIDYLMEDFNHSFYTDILVNWIFWELEGYF